MQYKWVALSVTMIGTLMAAIDGRIVVIGLPTIAQQLHASADEVVWITQAYVLSNTVCLLLLGRISDVFGRVKLYNIGFVVFTAGSALCSISMTPTQLIACRIFQGFGAGVLTSVGTSIVTDSSPRSELGMMLALNQAGIRMGGMMGLALSGLILALVDWRGLFYVNIPIGVFASVWANRRLKEISTKDPSRKMDWPGFVFLVGGLTALLLCLTEFSLGPSGTVPGFGLLALGLVLIVAFARTESRTPSPLLDLQLFKNRLFGAANVATLLYALAFQGMTLLMAFYLQIGLGYSPISAGFGLLVMEPAYLAVSLVSGKLSDKYGTRSLTSIGMSISAASFVVMSTFGASTQYPEIALVLVSMGAGNGMFNAPNTRAIMGSVPANRRGVASAFRGTMYQIGLSASYGIVLLAITFGVPYDALSQLLQGTATAAVASLARGEFFVGFRDAAIVLAIMQSICVIPCLMQGPTKRVEEQTGVSPQARPSDVPPASSSSSPASTPSSTSNPPTRPA